MSINGLEQIMNEGIRKYKNGEIINIAEFQQEVINTFKTQSDEIASLRQQLAQNPDYLYVPRMEGTDGVDNIR